MIRRSCEALAERRSDSRLPGRANRKRPAACDAEPCEERTLIERMFGRIGDRRCLATRTASPPPSFPVTGPEGSMSAADIEVDAKNLSISGTGISYTGYASTSSIGARATSTSI